MKANKHVLLLGLVVASGLSQAALVEDPAFPGLIRDTDQGITWLKNTNYNQTGPMTWYQAMAWAANLSISSGGQTFNTWRLPTVAEMTYLHENYTSNGLPIGTGFVDKSDPSNPVQLTDPGPFQVGLFLTIQSADAWALDQDSEAQAYGMDMDAYFGSWLIDKTISGDNLTWGAVLVPEPETWAMLLAGLGFVGWKARRCL